MDNNSHPKRVENYTDAFLGVMGILLFMTMWTVAALAGTLWAIVVAWAFDAVGTGIARRQP